MHLSKSTYEGIRSAIMHLYRICNVDMDDTFQKCMTTYIAGIKRVVAQEKKTTGQKIAEGKRDMPFEVILCFVCFLFLFKYALHFLF